MKLRYVFLSALALGIFACEQPQKKEETKKEEPKKEAVAQKQEAKKEEQKPQEQPKQEQKQEVKQEEQKQVAQAGGAGNPEKGKAIFQQKGCGFCHQPAVDTVGPSLKKIAQAYAGKEDQLVKFLKGEAPAIVDPAKEAIMKPQLMQLKGLSEQELRDLAAFIMSHK
ncbi:c-type cytochrome [Aquifex aeolicus]|uniref:Cytochrome c552 n=1 Tax=Aquifex aeolicus (strain VF5) TaxID=224324 RepID=O66981_AQUAE|nr:c-type cytochrome [Aquifex aeolicus]AAC06933.1 cytochrome c552 [Aquifex aeolicus VF5]